MSLSPADIRRLLNRAEQALGPTDGKALEMLFEELTTPEAVIMRRIERMAEVQAESGTVLREAIRVLDEHTAATARLAEVKEVEVNLLKQKSKQDHNLKVIRTREIIVPIVTAFTTFAAGYLTSMMGAL